jgi:hypothetical protein
MLWCEPGQINRTINVKPKLCTFDLISNLLFLHLDHGVHKGLGCTATSATVKSAHFIWLLVVVWLHLERFKIGNQNVIYLGLFVVSHKSGTCKVEMINRVVLNI